MNVVVTGSLGFDYIMDYSGRFVDRIMPDKINRISFAPLVDNLNKQFGGTAGNISYSLKLLGINPLILSSGGKDFDEYESHLKINKISNKYIQRSNKVVTGTYFVVTDQEDNQIGAFYKGALAENPKLSLKQIKDSIDFVILSPDEPDATKKYVKESKSMKVKYLYDPAFQIANFSKDELTDGLQYSQIAIGNDYEIDLICERLDITHEELIVMVPILITTLGSKGSVIETRKQSIHIKPAKAKNTSDPTGAGDAYRAGFIAGFLRDYDLITCGQMGSVAAVYTVEKYGTQTHTFTKQEFIKRYRENYGQNISL